MNKKQISTFIQSITSKDYSKANKQLGAIIENKLSARINNCKSKQIFKKSCVQISKLFLKSQSEPT